MWAGSSVPQRSILGVEGESLARAIGLARLADAAEPGEVVLCRLAVACCKVAVDACFLSLVECARSGKVS